MDRRCDRLRTHSNHAVARVLRIDIDAVNNAIELPWSNGQAEGQINRLKTLKRAMYGRAGPELLKARMLPRHHTNWGRTRLTAKRQLQSSILKRPNGI
jgi:hypothetical protein